MVVTVMLCVERAQLKFQWGLISARASPQWLAVQNLHENELLDILNHFKVAPH